MARAEESERWCADGKFFRSGGRRIALRAVTYGPLPGGWPESFADDFQRMRTAGFNSIRLFSMPDYKLLDAAASHGLKVFAGLAWEQNADFFRQPGRLSAARISLVEGLRAICDHPALAGCFVGNEIPSDLVRWMGPVRVREAIEDLIRIGRELAPNLLFAYANYPSTEYLEPENADFSAFNIYLEDPAAYRSYLKRLHHIAGDRPLVISEFGLDSRRNGLHRQAEALRWAGGITFEEEAAGFTIFAWSDRWWNNDAEVDDWDFGLMDRQGMEKPALRSLFHQQPGLVADSPSFSVIVCTRNGRERISNCLDAILAMEGGGFEVIVVDDGSADGTADLVAERFPEVRLLRLDPSGLSAARNAGADIASGDILAFTDDDCEPDREWLVRLRPVFAKGVYSAAGGPNLPPPPRDWHEAVVRSAPGAPSHVMLDDEEAEHLPGCNLAVRKQAFHDIGGFDADFHTAGDDVDFCWRLRAAGHRLGFAAGAFVWHHRRPSVRAFLRQQLGYGFAEMQLIRKHPDKFTRQGFTRWEGFIYGGGPVRVENGSIIYHGPMGSAGYQGVLRRMLPLRGLDPRFNQWRSRIALALVKWLVPRLRAWARNGRLCFAESSTVSAEDPPRDCEEFHMDADPATSREELLNRLLASGWVSSGPTSPWDAEKDGTRILLATEHHGGGRKRILLRVRGARIRLPFQ